VDLRRYFLALQLTDRFLQQAHVGIESDRIDVAVLLAPEQVACAPQLQVERRNFEPRPRSLNSLSAARRLRAISASSVSGGTSRYA